MARHLALAFVISCATACGSENGGGAPSADASGATGNDANANGSETSGATGAPGTQLRPLRIVLPQ